MFIQYTQALEITPLLLNTTGTQFVPVVFSSSGVIFKDPSVSWYNKITSSYSATLAFITHGCIVAKLPPHPPTNIPLLTIEVRAPEHFLKVWRLCPAVASCNSFNKTHFASLYHCNGYTIKHSLSGAPQH